MITGDIKNQVDGIWTTFWTGSSSLEILRRSRICSSSSNSTISSWRRNGRRNGSAGRLRTPAFGPEQHLRWSRVAEAWRRAENAEAGRDEVFPLHQDPRRRWGGDVLRAPYEGFLVFLITSPALLTSVVDRMEKLRSRTATPERPLQYMLSKLTTAGRNGQFRTPRHIIRMMVEMVSPTVAERCLRPGLRLCGLSGLGRRVPARADQRAKTSYRRALRHFSKACLRFGH
ncbi:MAG: hypothetical protein R3F39_07535 [Myxococcota bacterium]